MFLINWLYTIVSMFYSLFPWTKYAYFLLLVSDVFSRSIPLSIYPCSHVHETSLPTHGLTFFYIGFCIDVKAMPLIKDRTVILDCPIEVYFRLNLLKLVCYDFVMHRFIHLSFLQVRLVKMVNEATANIPRWDSLN